MRIVPSFIKTNLSHFDTQSPEVVKDNQINDSNRFNLIASHSSETPISYTAEMHLSSAGFGQFNRYIEKPFVYVKSLFTIEFNEILSQKTSSQNHTNKPQFDFYLLETKTSNLYFPLHPCAPSIPPPHT